jgi:predicted DsbA family dithiol-disulfide isomerase
LSFDLELTGFDTVEIDHLLDAEVQKLNVVEDDDEIPRAGVDSVPTVWVNISSFFPGLMV